MGKRNPCMVIEIEEKEILCPNFDLISCIKRNISKKSMETAVRIASKLNDAKL